MKRSSRGKANETAIEQYRYQIAIFLEGPCASFPLTGEPRRKVRWWARMAARCAFELRPDLRDT